MSLVANALQSISRRRSDSDFLQQIRTRAARLRGTSSAQLTTYSADLRELAASSMGRSEDLVFGAFALAAESLHRVYGFDLYDVQLLAARAIVEGAIAEMQTGEGKTFAALPAAVWGGLQGRGVHISVPNSYLAGRDQAQLQEVFEVAGLSSGLLPEREPPSVKRQAYACDVTYGSGYEFGFDYLRDQLILRKRMGLELGTGILKQLADSGDHSTATDDTCQRGLFFAIVDEADNVLIDDAMSPLILAVADPGEAPDRDAVHAARALAKSLGPEHIEETGPQQLELTEAGRAHIHRDEVPCPVDQLVRPWTCYVETALRAERFYQRDVHYVIDDGTVQIVDATTGRILADRSWQSGLHQAIEAKEGLTITPEKSALAQVTRQRFYRLYRRLGGMTGTTANCRREFRTVYDASTRIIPLRTPSQRTLLPLRCFANQAAKWTAIVDSIAEMHRLGRPVLAGTRTIAECEQLAERLRTHEMEFTQLDGRQDADEAEIVAQAGGRGKITIATNLAGRGTDIKLCEDVKELGGLHVIATECHESARIDRQMIGRGARQGDPGSAQIFVAMDDWLIRTWGSWLAESCIRMANARGEIHSRLDRQIRRIQAVAEQQQYAVRAAILRRDLANEAMKPE